MKSLPQNYRKRKLHGVPVAIGWEIGRDRCLYHCTTCKHFHIATGLAAGHARGSCPEMAEGGPTAILLLGSVPPEILRIFFFNRIGPQAIRHIRAGYELLDSVLSAQEGAS
jgi:hypothetical protein